MTEEEIHALYTEELGGEEFWDIAYGDFYDWYSVRLMIWWFQSSILWEEIHIYFQQSSKTLLQQLFGWKLIIRK